MKNLLPTILKIGGVSLGLVIFAVVVFYFWASSNAYPQIKYAEIVDYPGSTATTNKNEFTIITYNIG